MPVVERHSIQVALLRKTISLCSSPFTACKEGGEGIETAAMHQRQDLIHLGEVAMQIPSGKTGVR